MRKRPALSATTQTVRRLARERGFVTASLIADALGLSPDMARYHLQKLGALGELTGHGATRARVWFDGAEYDRLLKRGIGRAATVH